MKAIEFLIALMLFVILCMQFIQIMVLEDDINKMEDRLAQNVSYMLVTGN